ncbi:MAG: tetratricopeptide repeat protein [Myxococcota bacterium]
MGDRTLRHVLLALALAALCAGCQTPADGSDDETVAQVYLEAGRYQDAAREAELAIRREPENVDYRITGARAHAGLGHTQRAIDHLEVALGIAPGDPEISILLGEYEQGRENLPDAYVAFRRASKLAPDDIRAWSGLALSAEALGFEEEAADAYERWAVLEQEQGFIP